mgnify:FL=1
MIAMSNLNERKKCILRAVTDDYIDTAEPVGSRTIASRYKLGISSATIRNEMADLEESGYLYQPHTSAGRIPSDKGYRYYVDVLLEKEPITAQENTKIAQLAKLKKEAIEKLIRRSTKILAELTEYISVAVIPKHHQAVFKHLQLVSLDPHNILAIIVIDPGIVENKIIFTPKSFSPNELEQISSHLNSKLRGIKIEAIGSNIIREIKDSSIKAQGLLECLLELLEDRFKDPEHEMLICDGVLHLFEQPEFQDLDKTKLLLEMIEQRQTLANILSDLASSSGVKVSIGGENTKPELKELSLVTATYYLNGQSMGTIGVLGPTRMAYGRAITLVDEIAGVLNELMDSF